LFLRWARPQDGRFVHSRRGMDHECAARLCAPVMAFTVRNAEVDFSLTCSDGSAVSSSATEGLNHGPRFATHQALEGPAGLARWPRQAQALIGPGVVWSSCSACP